MRVAVEIFFAGLIAFLPNSSGSHSSVMTAYLLKDSPDHHEPLLRLFGEATLLPLAVEDDPCSSVELERGQFFIECDLSDTDIIFDTPIEEAPRYLRRSPRKELPDTLQERHFAEWLLRMDNVKDGTGRILPPARRDTLIESSFTFGWERVGTCELDGEELGRTALIRFDAASGPDSQHRQAVAESLVFTSFVRPGPIKIRLFDRKLNRDKRIIEVECTKQHCLTLSIENSLRRGMTFCEDGDHFRFYYDLVRNPGEPGDRNFPQRFRREDLKCVRPSERPVNPRLLECWRRLINPALPTLAEREFQGSITPAQIEQQTQKFLANLFRAKSRSKSEEVARDLGSILQVQDRVICPPAVLEP